MNKFYSIFSAFIFLFISCNRQIIDKDRIIKIGQALIKLDTLNGSRPVISDIVFIGDHLIEKVLQLKTKVKNYSFDIENGDFPKQYGDNSADCILIINTDYENIGVRLKYNKQKNKYDILGWKTF